MLFAEKLQQSWVLNQSLLCVGLDPLPELFPAPWTGRTKRISDFNKAIIDATAACACAFKLQIAHYAALAAEDQLVESIQWLKARYPKHIVILDAKRGDIDSTASLYAREVFERYDADAVTLNPYLGGDSLQPFLDYADRGCFILCRTSNPASDDFQMIGEPPLYLQVAERAATEWNQHNNVGLVAGATYPKDIGRIRKVAPALPVLAPGVGTQQGDLAETVRQGLNEQRTGLLINASRTISYASTESDFARAAEAAAQSLYADINAIKNASVV